MINYQFQMFNSYLEILKNNSNRFNKVEIFKKTILFFTEQVLYVSKKGNKKDFENILIIHKALQDKLESLYIATFGRIDDNFFEIKFKIETLGFQIQKQYKEKNSFFNFISRKF